jgi:hypothetical protein
VFSSHFLEHWEDWQDRLTHMCGMLRVGGVLFLYLPNPAANPHWSCEHDRQKGPGRDVHKVDLSPELVAGALRGMDMEVVEFEPKWDKYASFYVIARRC